jgi:hypothetical protein
VDYRVAGPETGIWETTVRFLVDRQLLGTYRRTMRLSPDLSRNRTSPVPGIHMDDLCVTQALTSEIGELGVSFRLCSAPNAEPNTVLDLLVATAVTWI